MTKLLQIENLCTNYGHIEVLHRIDLYIDAGEIVSIIGSNGAGKSTLLRTISGLVQPKSGKILFNGQDVAGIAAHLIASQGLTQVPEGRMIIKKMSVFENLLIGAHSRQSITNFDEDLESIYQIFPILSERKFQIAGTLSGGQQQMLALGRALMSKPRLLMLDEPSLGLAPIVIDQVFNIIKELRGRGITILLVEQNAKQALDLSDRAYVLELGHIVATGISVDISKNPKVISAYLGE
ncbi:MAG: ABC transporter ATP-binding protein [Burkholderiaceae bacterium]